MPFSRQAPILIMSVLASSGTRNSFPKQMTHHLVQEPRLLQDASTSCIHFLTQQCTPGSS